MVKTTILVKLALFQTEFSIDESRMDQNCQFWPEEVHFHPFGSANRTLAIPEKTRDIKRLVGLRGFSLRGSCEVPGFLVQVL